MSVLSVAELENMIRYLLQKYHAEYALLFGSYARGEATPESDIDLVVVGGSDFVPRDIFSLAEDLREISGRSVDAFELCEVNTGTPLYDTVMKEGIRIA